MQDGIWYVLEFCRFIYILDNSVLNRLLTTYIFLFCIFYRIKMASRRHHHYRPANNRRHLQQPPQYPRRRQWYLQKSSTMPQPFSPLQDLLQNGCCLNHLFQYLNQSRVPSTMPLEEFLVPKTQQIQILQMINRHLTQWVFAKSFSRNFSWKWFYEKKKVHASALFASKAKIFFF